MKWQDILKITGGTSSAVVLILLILNLSGMEYDIPKDIICTDCFSAIKINSTYWEICAEHSGNQSIVYKKEPLSRRLWINLDKVGNIIPTKPEVYTELLVPTTKKYAEFNTNYGYLRRIKDGDCIIKRRTKANPSPNIIVVHGTKTIEQTIKWGFNIDNYLMEGIELDPVWKGAKDCRDEIIKWTTQEPIYTDKTIKVYCDNINGTCEGQNINGSWYKSETVKVFDYYKINYYNKTICEPIGIVNISGEIISEEDVWCELRGNEIVCIHNKEGGQWNICKEDGSVTCCKQSLLTKEEPKCYNSIKSLEIPRLEGRLVEVIKAAK